MSKRGQNPGLVRLWNPAAAFVLLDSHWFRRHQGRTTPAEIVQHVRALDSERSLWVNLNMSDDLSPAEAHGLTAPEVAHRLLTFDRIRQRIHPS